MNLDIDRIHSLIEQQADVPPITDDQAHIAVSTFLADAPTVDVDATRALSIA